MPSATFTTDAIIDKVISDSFSVDAYIVARSFSMDAWILGEGQKHHRVRDHFGPESDLYVVLDSTIGKYIEGTPVHWVISDLVDRLNYLEDWNRKRGSFTLDSWLAASGTYGRGVFDADAIVEATITFTGTSGIKVDAYIIKGGSFSADATIMPIFTIDAFIV